MTSDKQNQDAAAPAPITYEHPLQRWLSRDWIRLLLGWLSPDRPGDTEPHLHRALYSYANPNASYRERLAYWPVHRDIDFLRGSATPRQLHEKLAGHPPTLRGIVATAQSIAHFGLTMPQRWLSPLFVVWNLTGRCNLNCRHCYQSSVPCHNDSEMSLPEKLDLIDQFGRAYVAMVAFAGGEPTLSPDLEPALQRCQKYQMHTTLATNGISLTPQRCRRLADLGLRYVEVSLDSIHPQKHDHFRGAPGAWRKAVEGIRNVIRTEGLRAGIAMCVRRDNLNEVEPMIRFAIDLGVSCFAHFNFIPVGRGAEIAQQDISPEQREELLQLLRRWMESRQIGIISTAPQFGRVCLMHAGTDGLISCSHAGNAAGTRARIVASYLGGCGAGRTYACVQPNGDVTPCVYMPGRIMGNVRRKPFSDIFQQSPWWLLLGDRDARDGHCGHCQYRSRKPVETSAPQQSQSQK